MRFVKKKEWRREESPLSFNSENYICFSCLYGRYSGPEISLAMTIMIRKP